MTLKKCSCGKIVTTKNTFGVQRDNEGLGRPALYFQCPACKSTLVLVSKKKGA